MREVSRARISEVSVAEAEPTSERERARAACALGFRCSGALYPTRLLFMRQMAHPNGIRPRE